MRMPDVMSAIPTIDRAVDSVPRRSATATWQPIHSLFSSILREHPRAREIAMALDELGHIFPHLFLHQTVRRVSLRCGDALNVAVAIRYAVIESAEHVEPPIANPPEVATDLELALLIEIAADHPIPEPVNEPALIAGNVMPVYFAPINSTLLGDPHPNDCLVNNGDHSL